MTILYANNANTTLAAGISNSATTIIVATGTGALFPSPTGGSYFTLTLNDQATGDVYEICHCTSRTGDSMTVTRGQEGTTAVSWLIGDFAYNAYTAASLVGRLVNVQVFATPGVFTYTPTPEATQVIYEVQGGSGGSGGIPATTSGQWAFSAGANAGAYAMGQSSATSQTITVGAAGAAGSTGGGMGGNGGTSSFGSIATAAGGTGTGSNGPSSSAIIVAQASNTEAVAAGGSIINLPGPLGQYSIGIGSGTVQAIGGQGGSSRLSQAGNGAAQAGSASAIPGNPGGAGVVLVWEFS